jgi:UDP-N-acetylmuramyl tripeptide synthase
VDADVSPELATEWLDRARILAERYGLPAPTLTRRGSHATLAQPCPPDLRDLAADVLDQATGEEPERPLDPRPDLALRAWLAAAYDARLPAFFDDDQLTIGLGSGSVRRPRAEIGPVDLSGVRRVPLVFVTGTNGKTTTANLIGAMARAHGLVDGVATSNGVRVAGEWVEKGDWSGPGAARIVGNDPRVDFAVLETARGGLLRRGLLVDHADVAVLTNVSADHLGEWGIDTVEGLARAKRIVAEAVRPGGTVVTNADDPVLEAVVAEWRPADVGWLRFSTRGRADAHLDGDVLRWPGGELPVAEVPLALGGAARYNLDNALAAALAGHVAGLPAEAIAAGLRAVRPSAEDNPGRTNVIGWRGATLVVDYAHNPASYERLAELVDGLRPNRRWMLLGQAGDRPDELVLALARRAAAIGCDRYVLKPLPGYARGRAPAEVVEVLRAGLQSAGVGPERIEVVDGELAGVQRILELVGPGDLALVLVHEDLDGALAEIART